MPDTDSRLTNAVTAVRFKNHLAADVTMDDGVVVPMRGPIAMASLADLLDRAENDNAAVEADMSWEPIYRILSRATWTD